MPGLIKFLLILIFLATAGKPAICQLKSLPSGEDIKYKTAIVFTKKKTKDGITTGHGCGFIVNNKYLATCYHVYKNEPTDETIETKVLYNIRQDSLYHYDSVMVDLNYQYSQDQYDFRKHEYLLNDPRTDFILLRLASPVKSAPVEIDTGEVKFEDRAFTSGYSVFHYSGEPKYEFAASALNVKYVLDIDDNGAKVIGSIGPGKEGFSGSPLFNTNGRIIGMIQGEVKNDDNLQYYFLPLLVDGYINQNTYNDIMRLYGYEDVHLLTSLSAEYFLRRYMAGFY